MQEFRPEDYHPDSNLWKRGAKKLLFHTPIFDLVACHTESPDGNVSRDFFHLISKDWVNIIALTEEGKILLINQYRHGLDRYSLEIPGGIAEKKTLLESAQAELREETGYISEDWEYLGKVSGNPAVFDNWCHTYIARNVHPHEAGQDLDESEQIDFYEYPLEGVPSLVEQNILHHGMMVAALGMFFLKYPLKK
ncbi:NUDIX domain protein [Leptospira broomii serovar Hurstbridge str. 5399]|uniref:GDP-mannose pyrophosphatase n=1 Tax=Leptospira broomii serovar Hurstbridge str. 5399 TaxID=1049789 RepID=T0GPK8_9LEPT|nr:NUDIX hydrolase [Leptospira broomii]EQA47263.1 NUDIX domain protein [Leptospira broomii serovar Hurstbridge str. 5399]